jgi:ribosomal protein L14E/L6E/L27E
MGTGMTSYFLTLCFVFFTSVTCIAQQFDMQCGPVLKAKGLYLEEKALGGDAGNFYTFRSRPPELANGWYSLLMYNDRMELQWERRLPILRGEFRDRMIENVLTVEGKIVVFTSGKENGLECAWVQEISREGVLVDEPVKVDEMPADTYNSRGVFEFSLSADSANIMVFHKEPVKGREPAVFSFILLDKSFGILWKKTFTYAQEKEVRLPQYTARGNMLYVLRRETEKEGNITRYAYLLDHYDAGLKEQFSRHVYADAVANGHRLLSLKIKTSHSGKLFLAALYSKKGEPIPQGFYLMTLDAEDKTWLSQPSVFPDDFKAELAGKDDMIYLNTPAFYESLTQYFAYQITDLLLNDREEVTLIAENFFRYVNMRPTTLSGAGGLTREEHFYFKNVIAVRANSEGVLMWNANIPKEQHTINDGGIYSSFMLIPYEDYFKLVYNDDPRNMDTGYSFVMKYAPAASTVVVDVDQEGNISKRELFPSRELKTVFIPQQSASWGKGRYLLYWKLKKRYRFCSIRAGH